MIYQPFCDQLGASTYFEHFAEKWIQAFRTKNAKFIELERAREFNCTGQALVLIVFQFKKAP